MWRENLHAVKEFFLGRYVNFRPPGSLAWGPSSSREETFRRTHASRHIRHHAHTHHTHTRTLISTHMPPPPLPPPPPPPGALLAGCGVKKPQPGSAQSQSLAELLAQKVGHPLDGGSASRHPSFGPASGTTPMATKIMRFQTAPQTPPHGAAASPGGGGGGRRGARQHSSNPLPGEKNQNNTGAVSEEDECSDDDADNDGSSTTLLKHHQMQHRLRKDNLKAASNAQKMTLEEQQEAWSTAGGSLLY